MPRFELDLDPITHITADAIGAPGKRVFYLQGWQEEKDTTILIEKFQLQSLSVGIEKFLADLAQKHSDLTEADSSYEEEKMHITPPVEPVFRAGEIGLGFDKERDLVVLVVSEIVLDGQEPETAAIIRFWINRHQLRALARWGAEVVNRGRPVCPQCGQPEETDGHFCPKKNGHKH